MKTWIAAVGLFVMAAGARAQTESPVTLDTGSGVLQGTLTMPAQVGSAGPAVRVPAVLVIAGSGPTDRDGNTPMIAGRSDNLKMLAQALARAGIASVRYDKRGIAASRAAMTAEQDLRFERYIDDAAGWVKQMRADARFGKIGIAGHSEGALIGAVAARQAGADAYVSLEGIARPFDQVLAWQLKDKLPPTLGAESDRILASLRKGQAVADVPQPLASLYRASVQPYLISLIKYDPAQELAKLTVPVLIVQGGRDVQAAPAEGEALQRALPRAEYAQFPAMTHMLKDAAGTAPADQAAAYTDPSVPLTSACVERIVTFLQGSLK